MLTPSPPDTTTLLAEVEALIEAHDDPSADTNDVPAAFALLRSLAARVRHLEALATGDAETIAAYATFARAVYRAHATPGCEDQGVRMVDLPRLVERVRETADARERLEAAHAAEVERVRGLEAERDRCREALQTLADAAEEFASSEPDMPSHGETVERFDAVLDAARATLIPGGSDAS